MASTVTRNIGLQRTATGVSLLKQIGKKKIPVHMVYGTENENTPLAGGRYMQHRIGPTFTLEEIPNPNHSTAQENGNTWRLIERLRKYIKR
ncbi:hypothetical protein BU23DRAFT_43813 [Bimuria novae-zelandiae CBS 107.79]|uniref:Uncharacterized protein n=1 Tax=Bimuria novae-zelandiae CBS 107.79 TaxID=1447943 RepID=A0A6A5VMK6_9PLEO|nr:hypothetical protein BU23DRAFT_43813 [Bimuria novae-zelandiae CBS 107.79]